MPVSLRPTAPALKVMLLTYDGSIRFSTIVTSPRTTPTAAFGGFFFRDSQELSSRHRPDPDGKRIPTRSITPAIIPISNSAVGGLGAFPIQPSPGVTLPAGTIIQWTPYIVTFNHTVGAFYLHGFYGNPYNVWISGARRRIARRFPYGS
jgi:hypothetical protein